MTEEWIALKDAALAAPSLGLDADAVAPFLGDCGFQNPGVEAGGGGKFDCWQCRYLYDAAAVAVMIRRQSRAA